MPQRRLLPDLDDCFKRMRLKKQETIGHQGAKGFFKNTSRFPWAENVELPEDRHHKTKLVSIVCHPDILLDIGAIETRFLRLLSGISY